MTRLGLVGYGEIAREHVAALAAVPELELVAIAEPDAGARDRAAEATKLATCSSAEELLLEHRVDAVLVCSPPSSHEGIATLALESGKHVLCEKPLAPECDAALRMLATAEQTGRHLMMASKFRYVADVQAASKLVAEGFLGDVVLYQNVFCSRVPMAGRWNSDPAVSGGGVLIDNGAHAADLAQLLVGKIARVMARFAPRVQAVPVEDTVRVLFEAESGCLGTIDLSWSIHREVDWYATVEGAKGTLRLGWRESAFKLAGATEWTKFGSGYSKRAALTANLLEFAKVVRGAAAPRPSREESLESVLVIDACYRAARQGAWTAVRGGSA